MRQLIIRADDLGYSESVNYKRLYEKPTPLGVGWIAQNNKKCM